VSHLLFFIHALVSMLAIINPIGNLPIFLALTTNNSLKAQEIIARRATLVAFVFLTVFAFLGNYILSFFGITLAAFRVAGGIILFGIGYRILQGQATHLTHGLAAHGEEIAERDDISIVPLAIPILAGPGSITTVMLLVGAKCQPGSILLTVTAVGVVSYLTYLAFRIFLFYLPPHGPFGDEHCQPGYGAHTGGDSGTNGNGRGEGTAPRPEIELFLYPACAKIIETNRSEKG